jgi:hypothetical protein
MGKGVMIMDTNLNLNERLKALKPEERRRVLEALAAEVDGVVTRTISRSEDINLAASEQERFKEDLKKCFTFDPQAGIWKLDDRRAQYVHQQFQKQANSEISRGRVPQVFALPGTLREAQAELEAGRQAPPSSAPTGPEE